MSASRFALRYLSLAALVCLAACGGGGGGGGGDEDADTIAVALDKSTIADTWVENTLQRTYTVAASFSDLPDERVYPRVVLSEAESPFEEAFFVAVQVDDDTYTTDFTIKSNLAPGKHEGTVTLHLCKDSQCTSEYKLTGNTLPYSFTVTPQLRLQTAVDGVLSVDYNGFPNEALPSHPYRSTLWANTTQIVEITSRAPVKDWAPGLVSGFGATFHGLEQTSTKWRGEVTCSLEARIAVTATPVDETQKPAMVEFTCVDGGAL